MPDSLQDFKDASLPSGQVRIMYCLICGAITYIHFANNESGLGDPDKHMKYHRDKGEIPAE